MHTGGVEKNSRRRRKVGMGVGMGWDGMEKLVPDFYSSQTISTDK
jgi:hypothetical protein